MVYNLPDVLLAVYRFGVELSPEGYKLLDDYRRAGLLGEHEQRLAEAGVR
jgi:hypothetical protein